jgi:hypothetical protein
MILINPGVAFMQLVLPGEHSWKPLWGESNTPLKAFLRFSSKKQGGIS